MTGVWNWTARRTTRAILNCLAAAKRSGASGCNNNTLPGRFMQVLLQLGAGPTRSNQKGETPLMAVCACTRSAAEDAQLSLLEQGAYVSARHGAGSTALQRAAANRGHALARSLAEMLFEFGDPPPDAVNNAGQAALDLAAEAGNEPLVQLLLTKQ